MLLEEVTAVIRPRTAWEAMDLGVALARRHFTRLYGAWAITVFPLCLLIMLALRNTPLLGVALISFLKPLFDRVPLWVLSHELFGDRPTYLRLWKALPGLMWRGFFQSPLIRRFSTVRSYVLPVIQLERLKGKALSRRAALLTREGASEAFWMMSACVMIELSMTMAGFMFVIDSVPEGMQTDWEMLFTDLMSGDGTFAIPNYLIWIIAIVYLLVMSIVEIFYVAAGFGLYINSRTSTEGWDIELAFRRLQKRLLERMAAVGPKVASVLILAFAALCLGKVASAQEVENSPIEQEIEAPFEREIEFPFDEEADAPLEEEMDDSFEEGMEDEGLSKELVKESIEEVLAQPEFEIHKTKQYYFKKKDKKNKSSMVNLSFMEVAGKVLFWGLLGIGVLFILLLLWKYRHLFSLRRRMPGTEEDGGPSTRSVMGLDITQGALPSDIAKAAWEKWLEGDRHQAASLLYRGALSWFVQNERLPIIESDTESDCLRHVRKHSQGDPRDYFVRLTRAWIQTAYGKEPPTRSVMEALCRDWPYESRSRRRS